MGGDPHTDKSLQETALLEFPELMEKVGEVIGAHFRTITSLTTLEEGLDVGRQVLEKMVSRNEPLTDRERRTVIAVRQFFDDANAMIKDVDSASPGRPSYIDPYVGLLLTLNYHDAIRHTDARLVTAGFRREVANLTKGQKGRPRTISEAQLRKAKRLRDAGHTSGQIGKKLSLDSRQVRTALKHHFPEKKSR